MITKRAISVTLHPDNLLWLKGRASAAGHRSVSELLDRLVTAARTEGKTGGEVGGSKSVVGAIEIDSSDPLLERADARIRLLFERSLGALLSDADRVRPGARTRQRARRG